MNYAKSFKQDVIIKDKKENHINSFPVLTAQIWFSIKVLYLVLDAVMFNSCDTPVLWMQDGL